MYSRKGKNRFLSLFLKTILRPFNYLYNTIGKNLSHEIEQLCNRKTYRKMKRSHKYSTICNKCNDILSYYNIFLLFLISVYAKKSVTLEIYKTARPHILKREKV